jgi:nucleotide-binding universal stress UspA family protein
MPAVAQQRRPRAPEASSGSPGRPVLLATLDVPFDHDAVVFAVDSAVEMGERLIVANVVEWAPLPLSTMLGYDELPYPPEMERSLAEPARLAHSLGIEVTRLKVKSLHPIPAMLEVVAEQNAGLFVFGPDRSRMMRLRYWRAARAIRSTVTTLIWLAG